MTGLLIVGAGGHGKVVADVALAMGKWEKIAFLDDRYKDLNGKLAFPVLGNLKNSSKLLPEFQEIIVAIGEANVRLELLERFSKEGFNIPVLVHPAACISPTAELGEGTVILPQAVINAATTIGQGCIINTSASVDHDCKIREGVHICPGVHMGGGVSVGRLSWIGIGSSVIQNVKIGNSVKVGAGSVIVGDIENDVTVAGVPARIIN